MQGEPASAAGQAFGEASCRKSHHGNNGPPGMVSGRSDRGNVAAKSKPASVPTTVISSGMIFSSTSIIEAASISAIRTTCERN